MKYDYKKAAERLMRSYDADEHTLGNNVNFSERTGFCIELDLLRKVLFPRFWNQGSVVGDAMQLSKLLLELRKIMLQGIRPHVKKGMSEDVIIDKLLTQLADIRDVLKLDIEAAFKGDPAARDYSEIIRSYPGFTAILMQRIAHVFYKEKCFGYARELTEAVHSITGIDIHPGAKIGRWFFIDHGNGVVIGETTVIGDWVRLYQGVTLGALHFEEDEDGLKKGYKRHPDLEDYIVVGAGAKILGPVSIGKNVSIGANAWIAEDIPNDMTVYISEHPKLKKHKNRERK